MKTHRIYSRGFTLLEITVVLFILGLMIAGLFGPLETQLEARDRRQTQDTLQQLVDALYGYALTNRRLPCPDTNGDGLSDETAATPATCDSFIGFLPSSELGVAQGDAWGNRFTYAVSRPAFTNPDTDGLCNGNTVSPKHFDLCSKGSLKVYGRGDNPATSGVQESKFELETYATGLPAVVISHGRNGLGAQTITGIDLQAPTTGTDEFLNYRVGHAENAPFMSRIYSRGTNGCADNKTESTPLCEYDDLVVWLAPTILNGRMVSAGRLP